MFQGAGRRGSRDLCRAPEGPGDRGADPAQQVQQVELHKHPQPDKSHTRRS